MSLADFIFAFWDTVTTILHVILKIIFSVIGWVLYVMFDGCLAAVYAFFQGLDLSALAFNTASAWTSLPPQLIWLVNELALPQCITIIVGTLGVRLILNLIPSAFTRI